MEAKQLSIWLAEGIFFFYARSAMDVVFDWVFPSNNPLTI